MILEIDGYLKSAPRRDSPTSSILLVLQIKDTKSVKGKY